MNITIHHPALIEIYKIIHQQQQNTNFSQVHIWHLKNIISWSIYLVLKNLKSTNKNKVHFQTIRGTSNDHFITTFFPSEENIFIFSYVWHAAKTHLFLNRKTMSRIIIQFCWTLCNNNVSHFITIIWWPWSKYISWCLEIIYLQILGRTLFLPQHAPTFTSTLLQKMLTLIFTSEKRWHYKYT